ncbi:aspartyl/asparaginyl beta-hydroxylase domain-containing protein [Sphingorhabdus sp. SMR4y]|uniref:aspartyl/asparaginyl beta-hydroxylase domain-containing protein n=1 Tax=Sphingorhabdus sp. SMR4y TaxID=2584094 RepID=UPI000B5CD23F|nr:aspartyl/asparaginyl beta-hydroxylase domain-containing protein [Sphingorhabdus sp. SMR4y]ASK87108.1 aspartyl/Asparaginyl beta-hydroxylase [Sphingorhabdus sp. SMR4y]
MLPVFTQPFVKLPLRVDVSRLQSEVAALLELDWLIHPSGFPGNLTLPLIAVNGQFNHDLSIAGQMLPTPALLSCPYIRQILAYLEVPLSRTRLMMLHSGAEVSRHYDAGYHWYRRLRIHIPIFTHPDVIFGCAEQERHLGQGELWCFDHKNWHWVQNHSQYTRIHLVIDTKASPDFFASLSKRDGQETEIPFGGQVAKSMSLEPYVFEVLEPEELSRLIVIMVTQLEEQNQLESVRLLEALARKWEHAFVEYQHNGAGESAYRQIIEELVKKIDRSLLGEKEDRAFNTIATMLDKSNGTPVFQRLNDMKLNFN